MTVATAKCEVSLTSMLMHPGVNADGTAFTADVIRKAVEDAQERVRAGQMHGGFYLPPSQLTPRRRRSRRMDDISFQVKKLEVNDSGEVYATIQPVDTPQGRELEKAMVEAEAFGELILFPEGSITERSSDGSIKRVTLTGVSIAWR